MAGSYTTASAISNQDDREALTAIMNVHQLNEQFAIQEQVRFVIGKGGFPNIEVHNHAASALLSVYAGQVLSFKPYRAADDLLFLSERAFYQQGKAIKGGIPICWPWFGPDPESRGRPAHGFVRTRPWTVLAVEATTPSETRLVLGLQDSAETRELWPHAFGLSLEVKIGSSLGLALITANHTQEALSISQALHSYFKVGDIERVRVVGLEGNEYFDKVDNGRRKMQSGLLSIGAEVDRIYTGVEGVLLIEDVSLQRRIRITATGSRSTVVWNPWYRISAEMVDLADHDYRHLLCVETANVADDMTVIPPAGEHRLGVEYRLEAYPGLTTE
jgi:glucose-6-phosphate 1-epimerase